MENLMANTFVTSSLKENAYSCVICVISPLDTKVFTPIFISKNYIIYTFPNFIAYIFIICSDIKCICIHYPQFVYDISECYLGQMYLFRNKRFNVIRSVYFKHFLLDLIDLFFFSSFNTASQSLTFLSPDRMPGFYLPSTPHF